MTKDNQVTVPDVAEHDITVLLPSGEKVILQYRNEGDFPSLDINFEKKREVTNWLEGMKPAPFVKGTKDTHICVQLVVMLDPKSETANWNR